MRDTRREAAAVLDVDADGAGPEESSAPAPFQNALESGVGGAHVAAPPPAVGLTPGG